MSNYREYNPDSYEAPVTFKNFQDTTKYKCIEAIANAGKKGITRKDIKRVVWANQGYDPDKFVYRNGHYSTGFRDWKYEGLYTAESGKWYITDFGKMYLKCENLTEVKLLFGLYKKARHYEWAKEKSREYRILFRENQNLRMRLQKIETEAMCNKDYNSAVMSNFEELRNVLKSAELTLRHINQSI